MELSKINSWPSTSQYFIHNLDNDIKSLLVKFEHDTWFGGIVNEERMSFQSNWNKRVKWSRSAF